MRGSSLTVRTALLANISSEICFDLAHGVRARNHWNNGLGQSTLHILQSNCIDPFDNNIVRLPFDVPIIYADSYLNYQKCEVPFCHYYGSSGRQQCGELPLKLCGITIGDSMYTISIYSR